MLYTNLQSLFNRHKYDFNHICDETWIQVGRQSGARFLARRRSNVVYSTIPKFGEWLTINCVVNAIESVLPSFYIFKGERLRDDYIKLYKLNTCMAMQKKAWMIIFLFKEFFIFLSQINSKWNVP